MAVMIVVTDLDLIKGIHSNLNELRVTFLHTFFAFRAASAVGIDANAVAAATEAALA